MSICQLVYTVTVWRQDVFRLCGEAASQKSQNVKFLSRWLQLGQIWTLFEVFFYKANRAGRAGLPAMKLNGRRNGLFSGFLSGHFVCS